MYVDSASNIRGSRIGVVMISHEWLRLEKSLRLGFCASNNKVEYGALIAGLRAIQKLSAKEVKVFSDSKLVVSQIEGSFETKDAHMQQYLKLFGALQVAFQKVSMVKIPRSQNSDVDSLATLASSSDDCIPQMISIELLEQPSIKHHAIVASTTVLEPSWMDPYISFLSDGSLPTDSKELEKVRRTSAHFYLFEDKKLYRRSFGGPYLLCLHPNKVNELLVKLYERMCGGHSGGMSLSHRAMTQGFWWPSM